MKKGKRTKRVVCMGLAVALVVIQLLGAGPAPKASAENADTANLRLLFTTDLHGQVTNVDFSTGAAFPTGGLAKANTLIKKARQEVGKENTMTFDLGDVMYDYTTDYIYDCDETAIQPIYQAMATIGYDAITLGNHDFEYTLPYIQNQLKATGLEDKVVVSNVKDANTGASIWNENKIIEKTLMTTQGRQITVKVGVIGETIPTLSKKRCNYTGVLATEDIVANTAKEAQYLKTQGADIVVVIAHSGVGEQVPVEMDDNVGYALTKLDNVDVVLCGHKHANFCADGTTKYDSYPGVDTKNGLVNGRNLVMVANSGKGIGQVDLTVSDANGYNQIVDRKSAIRKVKKTTAEDEAITNFLGAWAKTFVGDSTQILREMASGVRLQNYFGTLEDDGVIQLLNDMGISYGLLYQNNENTAYQNLPVVAASKYSKYGGGSGEDYYDISGNFTKANLYQIMNYRVQLWLYAVSGSQLKEWLEWSASAYETTGNILPTATPVVSSPASDGGIAGTVSGTGVKNAKQAEKTASKLSGASLVKKGTSPFDNIMDAILSYQGAKPLQSVLREEWLTDWSRYYVLDGVEYQIDTSIAPRYDYNGTLINDTRRVKRVTRNGQEIRDDEQFLLVVNRLASGVIPDQFVTQALGHVSAANVRDYFEEYMQRESMCGTMKNTQDNNWSVNFSDKYQYVVKTGAGAADIADTKKWIAGLLDDSEDFYYYRADFSSPSVYDTTGPSLNLKSLNDEETHKDVRVAVQATDPAGVHSTRYLLGQYTADSSVWDTGIIFEKYFDCKENGVYSVLAMDVYGNRTVRYIRINNINRSVLEAPKVKSYTNRKAYIEGTAEPTATVYFELENGDVYKTTVKDDGTFKYKLPAQKADSKVYVYVRDDDGRASARTVVIVKRTGPNKPEMEKLETRSRTVKGELNDANVYPIFIIDDKKTVFMQSDGTMDLYKKSTLYNSKYKVVEMSFNVKADGGYSFELPYLLPAKTKVVLRTLDVAARNSLPANIKVTQTVPAKPIVNEVTNLSTNVKVFSEEKCASATITVGKKKYTVKKSKYVSSKKMYCYTKKITRTDSGVVVKAYLTNTKGKSPVLKTTKKEVVPNKPKLDKVKAGTKKITGRVDVVGDAQEEGVTVENTKTRVFVYINKKKREAKVSFEGDFTLKLKKKIAKGTKISVKARNKKGVGLKRTVTVK